MQAWQPDRFLPGFEALELEFPDDYDGRVLATLVRLAGGEAPRGAVLWVHGFVDYFFQSHVAQRFAMEGYAFYALDLRKHGRSLRPHQHPNFCKNIAEYYPDITRSIDVIGEPVILAGHSTGGLIAALYAHEGPHRSRVQALWLNSPFFDWNMPDWRRTQLQMAAALGRFFPYLNDPKALLPDYTQALLDQGWEFDTTLKPVPGFPVYYGWLGAVADAQAKVHRGLDVRGPVLAMHSDEADIVLDWRHIARWGRTLGREASVLAFPGGLHDLVLSRQEIRDAVFSQLFSWAARAALR